MTDAPERKDPLTARARVKGGGCAQTNYVVSRGKTRLLPGVYCQGLSINGDAEVEFAPGIYTIKDGPLLIGGDGVPAISLRQ